MREDVTQQSNDSAIGVSASAAAGQTPGSATPDPAEQRAQGGLSDAQPC